MKELLCLILVWLGGQTLPARPIKFPCGSGVAFFACCLDYRNTGIYAEILVVCLVSACLAKDVKVINRYFSYDMFRWHRFFLPCGFSLVPIGFLCPPIRMPVKPPQPLSHAFARKSLMYGEW
jgi:hypothetical protein